MDPLVLLVEGSDTQRELLRRRLSDTGHDVDAAVDAQAATALARRRLPDLVLLDVSIPGALELLEELHAIPVIVLAERAQTDDVARALAHGAHDSLMRPIELGELDARCAAALRTKQLQDALREARMGKDEATGLPGRDRAEDELRRLVSGARRHGRPFAVLACEVDPYDAEAIDTLLRHIAERLTGGLRLSDLVCRTGPQGFLVVLPDCAPALTPIVGDRLRRAVESADFGGPQLTVSVGWACWVGEDADELVARAEAALAIAQSSGRNAVHPLTL